MEHFLAFVFCSLLCIASAKPVKDTDKPEVHEVIEGNDLRVVCNATEGPEIEIYWWKNDTKAPFREEGRYLTFENIHRNATGEYICYSENVTSHTSSLVEVVKVDVLYPGEITGFFIDKTVVQQDTSFEVHCNFTGNPTPDFIVMNNNTKHVYIEAHGSVNVVNVISTAQCEDAGAWICTGRNSLNEGKNATRWGNVTVLCAPHPDYDAMKDQYKIRAAVGSTAYLIMDNYGNPYPNYTWSHGGSVIPKDKHVDLGWASVLNITNVQEKDFGTYSLDMENIYGGYRTSSYELIPMGPPERPRNLQYFDVTHDSVLLQWQAGFNMGSMQYFVVLRIYDDDITVTYSDQISDTKTSGVYDYLVSSLTPETVYRFVVSAENSYGVPVLSENSVEFRTLAAPTTTTTTTSTTAFPFYFSYTTWGIITASCFGVLVFLVLLTIIIYLVQHRNKSTPYKHLHKGSKPVKPAPLELRADNLDMRKTALS